MIYVCARHSPIHLCAIECAVSAGTAVHVVAARRADGGASAVRAVLTATGGGCDAAAGLNVEPSKQGDAWVTRCVRQGFEAMSNRGPPPVL